MLLTCYLSLSYSAWLDESHDSIVDVMNRRIEAYTGLSMETAEKLQVCHSLFLFLIFRSDSVISLFF